MMTNFLTSKSKLSAGYFSLPFRLSGTGSLLHLTVLFDDHRPATRCCPRDDNGDSPNLAWEAQRHKAYPTSAGSNDASTGI